MEEIMKIIPLKIRNFFGSLDLDFTRIHEIRLRVNCPLIFVYGNEEKYLGEDGKICVDVAGAYVVSREEIDETMEYICSHSLYAYEDEIRQGFVTIYGGHRVGIAGKVVIEDGTIKSIKYISFINIRLSHQIKGSAENVIKYIIDGGKVHHTMIISPPGCGKTTLLRDTIRLLSNGFANFKGISVGVVDERSEIGGCNYGVPQNDLGIRTDVLDCCPKARGMMMLIRSMSPKVIAVDEIGSYEDIDAIENVVNCGCVIIATVHGTSIDDIKCKPSISKLFYEKVFERYIILDNKKGAGRVKAIYDSMGNDMLKRGVSI